MLNLRCKVGYEGYSGVEIFRSSRCRVESLDTDHIW
jgi:hypothetical protein